MSGFKELFRDAKDVRRIKAKMFSDGVRVQDLSYREMEKLRQVGVSALRHTEDIMWFSVFVSW